MKAPPRRFWRRAGFALGPLLAAGVIWTLASRDPGGPPVEERAAPPIQVSRFGHALDLLRRSRTDVVAAPTREDALGELFAGQGGVAKLGPVLAAIQANPTPPEGDPLWPEVVREISTLWNAETLTWGLDLMLTESRPRARRAVISSVAALANSDRARVMLPEQRQTLINHFIDLYQQVPPAQQPELLSALRRSGAGDAAEVLLGHGLASDDELAIHREQRQEIERSVREAETRDREAQAHALAPPLPSGPPPPHARNDPANAP